MRLFPSSCLKTSFRQPPSPAKTRAKNHRSKITFGISSAEIRDSFSPMYQMEQDFDCLLPYIPASRGPYNLDFMTLIITPRQI